MLESEIMNIFLDSNAFYNDPFLSKGRKAILLRLAKHEDVKLYINETVYQEVFRTHSDFLNVQFNQIHDSFQRIKSYLDEYRDIFNIDINIENVIEDFHDHFSDLENEHQLTIIPYDSEVLKYIVEIDQYAKQPFIKKQESKDKQGKKTTVVKKEIRDAIIWFSYKIFIENNSLENCYFISNNTKEFGKSGFEYSYGNPYELHDALNNDNNITAYKTIEDFLIHNDYKIKELFKDENFHAKLLSEDFYDQIYEELENDLAKDIVSKYLKGKICESTENFLLDMEPETIHDDYFMGGYISTVSSWIHDEDISFLEMEIYGDAITITANVEIETDVEIYIYNPSHDRGEDKYQYQATDKIKVEAVITFLISIDEEKELDHDEFSFREYIKNIEPNNLNIEFIHWENIDHIPMFDIEEELILQEEIKNRE